MQQKLSNTAGFSLIELLCALTIGLIVATVIMEIFLDLKKTYAIEKALSEIQENARFAEHILRQSIEHAGLIGCVKLTPTFPITDFGVRQQNKLVYNNYFTIFSGVNGIWIPQLPQDFKFKPKEETDVILVRNVTPLTGNLLQPISNANKIYVSLQPKFSARDDILIADYSHAALAQLRSTYTSTAKQYQLLTTSRIITTQFDMHAGIGEIQTRVFYIKKTTRKNNQGKAIYALYQIDARGRSSELIANIINLKVSCYILKANGKLQEKTPQQIYDWTQVSAIKVQLLLVSTNEVLASVKHYEFNHRTYYPHDRRLYKTVQFIIPLRERS
jgi:type IV pilus assembly protein PilW